MKNFVRLTDLQPEDVYEIFRIADEINSGKYKGFLSGKSVILFFLPQASGRGSLLKRALTCWAVIRSSFPLTPSTKKKAQEMSAVI